MRYVLAVLSASFVFTAASARADDKGKATLPPVGVWVTPKTQPDFLLDYKGDKTPNSADGVAAKPPVKKEETLPFMGFSLTRPFGSEK